MAKAKLLPPSQVLSILRERQLDARDRRRRTLAALGRANGVTAETVRLIEQRRIWKKLSEEDGVCR